MDLDCYYVKDFSVLFLESLLSFHQMSLFKAVKILTFNIASAF